MFGLKFRPKLILHYIPILMILFTLSITRAFASSGTGHNEAYISKVLLALLVIIIAAKLGGDLFTRIGQPAVLGELVFGIILGNLCIINLNYFDFIKTDNSIWLLSQIGVILLLFQVGLESDSAKMAKVGVSSILVATIGIIAPFFLGWLVAAVFLPNESVYAHLFVGTTLCATSVGITARVLMDLQKLKTLEAQIILGAAVVDDVLGLIVLAIVQGIVTAASGQGEMSSIAIFLIVFKATAFLFGAFFIGRFLAPKLFKVAFIMKSSDMLLLTAIGICFSFAYIGSLMGLAPIVGAFAAGLILEELNWRDFHDRGESSVKTLIAPLVAFLTPIFFIRMGVEVDLRTFAKFDVLLFAVCLTFVAILGKQLCGLGVIQKGINKVTVGLGMIPRGEVGLIIAAIGSTLVLKGERLISPATFSGIVIMVVVTTMVTPPILKWSFNRSVNPIKDKL